MSAPEWAVVSVWEGIAGRGPTNPMVDEWPSPWPLLRGPYRSPITAGVELLRMLHAVDGMSNQRQRTYVATLIDRAHERRQQP